MGKKILGFIGLSGLACIACCAAPLLSFAGLGAGSAALWKGSLSYVIVGSLLVAAVTIVQLRKRAVASCSTNSCDINCGCKSKSKQ